MVDLRYRHVEPVAQMGDETLADASLGLQRIDLVQPQTDLTGANVHF
jgi:hypothetical protein